MSENQDPQAEAQTAAQFLDQVQKAKELGYTQVEQFKGIFERRKQVAELLLNAIGDSEENKKEFEYLNDQLRQLLAL